MRQRRDDRKVESGEERQGGEHGRDPGHSQLLRHHPAGERQRVGDDRVGVPRRLGRVLVRLAQVRENDLPHHDLRARPGSHRPREQLAVARIGVGAHRAELEALGLDDLAVVRVGGEDRLVSAIGEPTGEREIGIQVAERAEGRDEDAHRPASLGRMSGREVGLWLIKFG